MRGAGPAGGLLFLAVVAFVGWLVVMQVNGALRVVLLAVVATAVAALAVNVIRRR